MDTFLPNQVVPKSLTRSKPHGSVFKWNYVIISLLGMGVFLRLYHFVLNRSFWSDEIYLSISFLKMNFFELASLPLDFQQKAPLGYLWMVKASVVIFGNSEMAMRLFPLLCGIGSLLVFVTVARHFLKPATIAIAVGILALSPHIVYHSVEAKQYSTEVFATILALYLYIRYSNRLDIKSLILWAFWGSSLLWFSYTSVFVLAGMAAGISLSHILKRERNAFFLHLIPFFFWLISFGVNYFLFTYKHAEADWLVLWFKNRDGFIPSQEIAAAKWLLVKSFAILNFPLGLSWFTLPKDLAANDLLLVLARMAFIPYILIFIGVYGVIKNNIRWCLILLLPLVLHLIASRLLIYPFYERLTVYLTPLLILLLALGCDAFLDLMNKGKIDSVNGKAGKSFYASQEALTAAPYIEKSNRVQNSKKRTTWTIVLTVLILLGPLMHSAKGVIEPEYFGYHKHWHQRELYQYINKNYEPGDAVYVYYNAVVPYQYYNIIYDYKYRAIEGQDHRGSSSTMNEYFNKLQADIDALRKSHNRVWVVHNTHFPTKIGEIDEEPQWYYKDLQLNLKYRWEVFNSIGKQVDKYLTKEHIHLYLYEVK